jgi:WD40 repeat protein
MSDKLNRHQFLVALVIVGVTAVTADADSPLKLRFSGLPELPVQSRTVGLISAGGQPVIVTAIAADPTSETIAVAGDDNQIRVMQSTTLATIKTLSGHRDRIRTLTFDPSGNRLVSAGNDGQVIVWDCNDNYAIRQRMEGTPAMARVRFAPSGGEMAAVGFDNEIYIMGRKGRGRPTMTCDCRDLRAIAYSDDEKLLAIAGRSGDLHLFETETGRSVGDFPIHHGRIDDMVFARSSNMAVSVGEDGRLVTFDTHAGKIIRRTKITSGKLFAIAMLDSRLAAVAGSDNVIRVVNIDNGKIVRSLEGHLGSVPTLAATGGYLFSGGFDATLRRWAIADLQPADERIAETDNGGKRE